MGENQSKLAKCVKTIFSLQTINYGEKSMAEI